MDTKTVVFSIEPYKYFSKLGLLLYSFSIVLK